MQPLVAVDTILDVSNLNDASTREPAIAPTATKHMRVPAHPLEVFVSEDARKLAQNFHGSD